MPATIAPPHRPKPRALPATRPPVPDAPRPDLLPSADLDAPTVAVPWWVVTPPPDRPTGGDGTPVKIRFTLADVERMDAIGLISERTELIDGELFTIASQGNAHSLSIEDLRNAIRPAWMRPKHIKTQSTHRFPGGWLPEPDLVLYDERPVQGATVDPTPRLIVEVAFSTLAYDLGEKRLRYARERVADYWVADLLGRRLYRFRSPDPDATDPLLAYADQAILGPGDDATPLAIPSLRIAVADVLPAAGVDLGGEE